MYCIGKGKEHKKYEFGSKASVVVTKNNGIIVGAVSHAKNKAAKVARSYHFIKCP